MSFGTEAGNLSIGAPRDLRDAARSLLTEQGDDRGMCRGCFTQFEQLKPYPCTQAQWALNALGIR